MALLFPPAPKGNLRILGDNPPDYQLSVQLQANNCVIRYLAGTRGFGTTL
jgi:hypothetical protein